MKNKLLALKLLKQKIHDPSLTFPLISEKTGYSKRQLIYLILLMNHRIWRLFTTTPMKEKSLSIKHSSLRSSFLLT